MDKQSIEHAFWALEAPEVLKNLETTKSGINDQEAQKRLDFFGKNAFEEDGHVTKLQLILNQFRSPLIFILVIAGTVTLFLRSWVDASVIFLAVIVNTALGFYQENRAEEALEKLKTYIVERVRVIRQGREKEIPASDVVPGDIVHLTSGARVSADARLLEVNSLSVEQAILTGESLPVLKTTKSLSQATEVVERTNMVYAGTLVVGGSAMAVVTSTGKNTEIGHIAELVAGTKREKTPLQKSLGTLAWIIAAGLAFLISAVFFLGISRGESVFDMFLVSVAMAVGAIPEALPVALTVILAVGVERLVQRKGVVRKLAAAESLGSTTVILTDKTGTLTQAKLELEHIFTVDELHKGDIGSHTKITDLNKDQMDILKLALVNTDVLVENIEEDSAQWRYVGNSLEVKIYSEAKKRNVDFQELKQKVHFDRVLEFSSQHKFSASFVGKSKEFEWDHLRGKAFVSAMGAPEILLEKSNISKSDYIKVHNSIEALANDGKRVIGVAVKTANESSGKTKALKPSDIQNMDFVGVIAFHDPIRPEVKDAMERVRQYGVRAIMVTGDLKGTAMSVARELGWEVEDSNVLTGVELKRLSNKHLLEDLNSIKIFARVSPEDKLRIAQLYKESGETVAMTGDGVNDAPSLKAVDIGIAVGSGTDVAKEVADLVLLDDNFQTIVAAIEEGRRILSNIKKSFVYLLSNSLDAILIIGGSLLAGFPLPLTALQILWVNFFTGSMPALALAFEEQHDYDLKPSSGKKSKLLDSEVLFLVLGIGVLTSAMLFVLYWFLFTRGFPEELVRTFIFATFVLYALFLAWPLRSLKRSIFEFNPFGNKWVVWGISAGVALTVGAIYIPFLQNVFTTSPLPFIWAISVIGWVIVNIALVELTKWFFRNREKNPN